MCWTQTPSSRCRGSKPQPGLQDPSAPRARPCQAHHASSRPPLTASAASRPPARRCTRFGRPPSSSRPPPHTHSHSPPSSGKPPRSPEEARTRAPASRLQAAPPGLPPPTPPGPRPPSAASASSPPASSEGDAAAGVERGGVAAPPCVRRCGSLPPPLLCLSLNTVAARAGHMCLPPPPPPPARCWARRPHGPARHPTPAGGTRPPLSPQLAPGEPRRLRWGKARRGDPRFPSPAVRGEHGRLRRPRLCRRAGKEQDACGAGEGSPFLPGSPFLSERGVPQPRPRGGCLHPGAWQGESRPLGRQ